ncbi:MAG: crossover junction endodeoxyribonuclease RuvC [Firmicutes bacterium]|nr:crossover junction endodeoxyribonuclease RuvC [Bacillota bacterium]MDD4336597.1 crossover junction endodeoxyribonuclease RuvC [Bacillota bacterium]MDD4791691.1 crossover junction endodeoxyribonuclease RuvC [Bacillota bacterium]
MLVLGIDPGTAITGYGLVREENGKLACEDMGCVLTRSELPLATRLLQIYDELREIIERDKPDCAAIEQLFFNVNAKSALAVGHARGVALLACAKAGIPVAEYTPLQVKMAVAGYGRADKKQVQSMVKLLLALDQEPKPDDVADALAIAICHLSTAPYLELISRDGERR